MDGWRELEDPLHSFSVIFNTLDDGAVLSATLNSKFPIWGTALMLMSVEEMCMCMCVCTFISWCDN